MNNNVYAGYVVSEPTAIAARTYTFPNISDDQIMMTLYRTYSNGQLIDIINRNFITTNPLQINLNKRIKDSVNRVLIERGVNNKINEINKMKYVFKGLLKNDEPIDQEVSNVMSKYYGLDERLHQFGKRKSVKSLSVDIKYLLKLNGKSV